LNAGGAEFFQEPISKFRLPFIDAFLVHDPQSIKHVLMDNSKNYPKDKIQRRILSSGLADGLLSVEGERWEVQRRALAPLFARRTINTFTEGMLTAANELVANWTTRMPSKVDIAAEMTWITLRVLTLTIFSDGIGDDFGEFRTAMDAYFRVVGRIGALDLLGVPKFVPRPGFRGLRRTMSYFEGVIDKIIDMRREKLATANGDGPNDLLTLLLRTLDPSTGLRLSLPEVRSNILTFLSAGHETTAKKLAWSIFLLSQSAKWRLRVQEEADRELSSPVNLADRLVVTRAVIEEALRLYPPIAALSRKAVEADALRDLPVKPNSLIVIAPYVLHRHHAIWDRPDAFDPSRFLPEARAAIPRFAYLPFGIGARTCIASSFALQEATIVLAVLLRHFNIRLSANADVWPLQRITLRPAHGLPMELTRREDRFISA